MAPNKPRIIRVSTYECILKGTAAKIIGDLCK